MRMQILPHLTKIIYSTSFFVIPPYANGVDTSTSQIYMQNTLSPPKCRISFSTRITSNTFYSYGTGAVHAILQIQATSSYPILQCCRLQKVLRT